MLSSWYMLCPEQQGLDLCAVTVRTGLQVGTACAKATVQAVACGVGMVGLSCDEVEADSALITACGW